MDEEIQQLNEWKDQLILLAAEKGAQFVAAILIVIIGFWLGKSIAALILRVCEKRSIDITLARFFAGFSKLLIVAFAGIMALGKLKRRQ